MEPKKLKLNIGGFFGLFLYYIFIGGLLTWLFSLVTPDHSSHLLKSILLIVKDVVPLAVVLYLLLWSVRFNYEPGFKFSFLGDFNYKLLLSVLLVTLGYFFWFHNSIGIWSERIPLGKFFEEIIRKIELDIKEYPIPYFLQIAIFAPFFEEVLFRGIILRGFLANYKPTKAIFLSALFFGLIHMNGPQFVNAFLIGLFLGIVYYRTRSLLLCIAVHAMNNSIGFLDDSDKFQPGITGFLIGIAVFSIGIYLFSRLIPPKFTELPLVSEPEPVTTE